MYADKRTWQQPGLKLSVHGFFCSMPRSVDVDLAGLAEKWDADIGIRNRLCQGGDLLRPETRDKLLVN